MTGLMEQFRRAALAGYGSDFTDGQLLERFLAPEAAEAAGCGVREAAFTSLVRRHGPMVLGVCRRVLNNPHDADDAFQATFLVLVRKAAALLPRDTVGNWLYGVAYHTALKARARGARRRFKEAQVRYMPKRDAPHQDNERDWQPLLDQELSRLPDKYREPVVLCELEGKTRKEAARQLGLPEGTLSGRLTTARRMLAQRLARRGVALSAGALAATLSQQAATASVPTSLMVPTVKAAALLAAGETTAGIVSANVAALTEGMVKGMLMSKLKITAAILVVAGLVGAGGTAMHRSSAATAAEAPLVLAANAADALLDDETGEQETAAQTQRGQRKGPPIASGKLQDVDAGKHTITISSVRRGEAPIDKIYAVAKDAKVQRDGRDVRFADLKKGGQARLELSADQKTAVSVSVTSPAISAPLKSVDAAKNSITITIGTRATKQDKTLTVAKDAKITVDGKDARLADLKEGAVLSLVVDEGNTVLQVKTGTATRRKRP
jgi:RNA polymerase sigma factor (sigma-70 family)